MRYSTAAPSSGIRLTSALIDRRRTGGHRPEMQLIDPDPPHTAPAKNIGALVGDALPDAHAAISNRLGAGTLGFTALSAGAAPLPSLGQAAAGVA